MSTGHLLVLGASLLWILFCMRFWWVIDRDNVWQRRLIAIAAGVGGGMIYLIGTLMLQMLKESSPPMEEGQEIRVSPRPAPEPATPKVNP